MPVIIFVTTIVLLLGMMSYARIDQYRSFSAMKSHFEQYMTTIEREYYSLRAIRWYNETKVADGAKKGEEIKATPLLSLFPLFDKNMRKAQEIYDQHRLALRMLLNELYRGSAFYNNMVQANPEFVDKLIDAMIAANDKMSDGQKVKEPKDLANLDLGDPKMNELLYKILKGKKRANSIEDAKQAIPEKTASSGEILPIDDGYLSLLDYINIDSKTKLRVFLASEKLLLALTNNNQPLVKEILDSRLQLFNSVKGDPPQMSTAEASKQFANQFAGRISSLFNENFLDFSVSKTNPSSYK